MLSTTNFSAIELKSQSDGKGENNLLKHQESAEVLKVNVSFEGHGAKFPLQN